MIHCLTNVKHSITSGGWKDAYTDAVLRMVQKMPHTKGLIGPWPHEWPDKCIPGNIFNYAIKLIIKPVQPYI